MKNIDVVLYLLLISLDRFAGFEVNDDGLFVLYQSSRSIRFSAPPGSSIGISVRTSQPVSNQEAICGLLINSIN